MTKRNKIIYWIATLWLALGMTSTGVVQLIKMKEEVEMMDHLGYPIYFLTIIGIWKILGVFAVLIPKFTLLKEWAYAGFFFVATGALFSQVASHNGAADIIPCVLLVILTVASWMLRPESRRLVA